MSVVSPGTPPAEAVITEDVVRALIDSQFPIFAHLPLVEAAEGWDNVMFRLGDELAVRVPRRQVAADMHAAELDWLPRIGGRWAFPAPVPLAVGGPGEGYPWRWSVVPWIEGAPALDAPLSPVGAAELGRALAQVHREAPPGAPHNPFRSVPLAQRAERFDARADALVAQRGIDVNIDRARAAYVAGAAAERGPLTWCHLDLHGRNVLTTEGRLAGIIDWGDAAVGDPAADIGQARVLLGPLIDALIPAYREAGGPIDARGADADRVHAEAVYFAVLLATLDDEAYAAAGWRALEELGLAA